MADSTAARRIAFSVPGHWVTERKRKQGTGKFTRLVDEPDRKDFKAKVSLFAASAMTGSDPLAGPLRMRVEFLRPRPASWPKRPTQACPWPEYPYRKPDVDNMVKIASDALSGIVWHDDAQVCERTERKAWADRWEVVITVEELES